MLVTDANLEQVLAEIRACENPVVDLETDGLEFYRNLICGYAISTRKNAYYIPIRHAEGNVGDNADRISAQVLETISGKRCLYWNASFDVKFLHFEAERLEVEFPWVPADDGMIAHHLVQENEWRLALKWLGDRYLPGQASLEQKELEDRLKKMKLKKHQMNMLPSADVEAYACQDVRLTQQLFAMEWDGLDSWNLLQIYEEMRVYQMHMVKAEYVGMRIDRELCARLNDETTDIVAGKLQALHDVVGEAINPRSFRQIQAALGLPVGNVKDGGASTRVDDLEKYRRTMAERECAIIDALLDYRAWDKVQNTYYGPFLTAAREDTNTIHPSFRMTGTVSGRLSCTKPNLQAIPRTSDVAKVKDVFLPREGNVFVELDYSQMELRLASHFGPEMTMGELLNRGADIHSETANDLHMPRNFAKRINFSVVYGIGVNGLSKNLDIPKAEASDYLTRYRLKYPGFQALYRFMERVASAQRWIRMFTGRIRHFNDPADRSYYDPSLRMAPYHKASSNFIQGGVAEVIRLAILDVMEQYDVLLINQVHDSIIIEVTQDQFDAGIVEDVRRTMANPAGFGEALADYHESKFWRESWRGDKLAVDLKVDAKAGPSWGAAEDI